MPEDPALSIIIASYGAKGTIGACLDSLRKQVSRRDFEIILIDSSPDDTAAFIRRGYPEVRLYHFNKRKFPGHARNIGIKLAKGNLIAFIDADCIAKENWVEEILKAHASSLPAIGGAIANGNPESRIGWAAYFCEFSHWMPETPRKWMDDIATANMSYKKGIFDSYGKFLAGTYCSDTNFHWRIGRDGLRLLFLPSMIVFHSNIHKLDRFLSHEFSHGRYFARMRMHTLRYSTMRRFVLVSFFPAVALKIFLRIILNNLKNRVYFIHFLRALPLLAAGVISWTLGETAGYAGG